ncbi:MAG: hypothetical protein KAU20_00010 [Nanoarchaeota archaeon]|nr:hypothetical protein [Nanoarchaeota archaeon]
MPKNAGAELRVICATVKSGGGDNLQGIDGLHRSADMGVATKTVSTILIPLISIRSKSNFQGVPNLSLAIPLSVSLQADNPIRYVILHNAALTGAVWADVDANESAVEYDITASAVANGHQEYSDYLGTSKNQSSSDGAPLGKSLLWSRKGSETGILTIAAVRSGATDADVLAAVRIKEIK